MGIIRNVGVPRTEECKRKISKNHACVKGSLHPRAKLSEQNVIEIKQMLLLNKSQKFIAQKFDVGISTIGNIKRGNTWREV